MADLAHELTDRELTALEKKIAAAYERAMDKVQERADKFFDTFTSIIVTSVINDAVSFILKRF